MVMLRTPNDLINYASNPPFKASFDANPRAMTQEHLDCQEKEHVREH